MNNINVLKRVRILAVIIVVILWTGDGRAREKKISFDVQQITSGPKHHFFGYVGHALTIPWNKSGRYIVALRTDFYKRMPKKGESAEVVIIDTQNNFKVIPLDKTFAWNLQQGTMFYWNPNVSETQFLFNDLDPETGVVFTVLYDIKKKKRIREYRYKNESIANGGVAPSGKYFAGINYGKISRTREIISYAGAKDWTLPGAANPDNDGLFKIDIATGERHLLLPYSKLAKFLEINDEYPIYVHHTLWNRNSDRIIFTVRGGGDRKKKRKNKWPNTGCVIRSDGSGLGNIEYDGHPEWYEGNLLSLPGKSFFRLYDVDEKKMKGQIGEKGTFPSPGNDNAFSPDGKWYVGSHRQKKKKECIYTFFRFADKEYFRAPPIPTREGSGVTRIDTAPRWNRTSDAILAPGVAEDGSRQLFIVRILSEKK